MNAPNQALVDAEKWRRRWKLATKEALRRKAVQSAVSEGIMSGQRWEIELLTKQVKDVDAVRRRMREALRLVAPMAMKWAGAVCDCWFDGPRARRERAAELFGTVKNIAIAVGIDPKAVRTWDPLREGIPEALPRAGLTEEERSASRKMMTNWKDADGEPTDPPREAEVMCAALDRLDRLVRGIDA